MKRHRQSTGTPGKSKRTKSNSAVKILRMISRDEQIERNGGGQFVAVNRPYKNKKKYDRKVERRSLRDIMNKD